MALINWFKKEILQVFFTFLFFAISFVVINMSEYLILKGTNISNFAITEVLIAAAVIAKIVYVIDKMPWVDLFPKKPLIWNVCWKSLVYWFITFVVRISVRFYPYLLSGDALIDDADAFFDEMNWYLFCAIQIIYLGLFFEFALTREGMLKIGPKKLRKMYFGF